jgi:PEP-CTERM motif-containing protein
MKLLFIPALAFATTLIVLLSAGVAKADTIYTYSGAPFTFCLGTFVCDGTNHLTATLDVKDGVNLTSFPVQNLPAVDIVSYSMSDGTVTNNEVLSGISGAASDIVLATDATGNIIYWFTAINSIATTGRNFGLINTGPNEGDFDVDATGDEANSFVPGTWTKTVTGVPEPTSLALLGVGMLTLAGLTFKKVL